VEAEGAAPSVEAFSDKAKKTKKNTSIFFAPAVAAFFALWLFWKKLQVNAALSYWYRH
jgi:hypothetical protein